MKAMILAAGYGTRIRPVTYTLPKPMVPVCNRPLIAYAVDAFLGAGIRDIVVNVHHLPDAIESALRLRYAGECRFDFSFEPEILGTGGGVRKVRSLLDGGEFLLVNADTIQFPRWEDLLQARRERDSLAALTLRHPPAGDRFTPVYLENGLVTGFGTGRGEALMFSGSHAISPRIFEHLPDKPFSGIVDEVYQPLITSGRETVAGPVNDGLWFDIGNPPRYMGASRALLDLTANGDLVAVEGSRVDGDSLVAESSRGRVSHSTLGERSVVEGQVHDSVIWNDCHIAGGVRLEGCIVAHGVEIRHDSEYRNVLICRDDPAIPRDAPYRFENGLVLADIG
ncbi:MAG: sugar phosphate nucleotidyltransferase [Acidobacteriota bacterium]